MKNPTRGRLSSIILLILLTVGVFNAQTKPTDVGPTGKTPIIIIPGLTGSDLVNSRTGEEVWFKARRAKDDDLRLPISANLAANRDSLVSRDIIRSVRFLKLLPETEIYERLIDALQTRGFREAKWNSATRRDDADTFYVFPYDWRRDNVENARLLIRRIETLKRRLGKPNLKFNVIAHSMGGLLTRYAAMYGNADLTSTPTPTWAGAKHFSKIFLLGTPNQGSIMSLNAMLNGFSYIGGGLNLPFIQDISRFDVFTIPSIYQLLPPSDAFLAFDEELKPLTIDIYDPAVWEKYNWAVWQDDDFAKKFTPAEQRNARAFFIAALARAKMFHAALNTVGTAKPSVAFYLVGADCKETPAALLLLHDGSKNRWETRFKADGYSKSNGDKVKAEQLKPLLFTMGDSVVTKSSLAAEAGSNDPRPSLPVASELYQCVGHTKLVTSPEVQDKLFAFLNAEATAPVASN